MKNKITFLSIALFALALFTFIQPVQALGVVCNATSQGGLYAVGQSTAYSGNTNASITVNITGLIANSQVLSVTLNSTQCVANQTSYSSVGNNTVNYTFSIGCAPGYSNTTNDTIGVQVNVTDLQSGASNCSTSLTTGPIQPAFTIAASTSTASNPDLFAQGNTVQTSLSTTTSAVPATGALFAISLPTGDVITGNPYATVTCPSWANSNATCVQVGATTTGTTVFQITRIYNDPTGLPEVVTTYFGDSVSGRQTTTPRITYFQTGGGGKGLVTYVNGQPVTNPSSPSSGSSGFRLPSLGALTGTGTSQGPSIPTNNPIVGIIAALVVVSAIAYGGSTQGWWKL